MYKEVFKLRILARRKELGLSQIRVSTETEITQSNISKFESGNLEPNLETLGKLANYYQVSTDWLIGNQYGTEQGSVIVAAINDFYDEVIKTIDGAIDQKANKEETYTMIMQNLIEDKEKITKRYTIK